MLKSNSTAICRLLNKNTTATACLPLLACRQKSQLLLSTVMRNLVSTRFRWLQMQPCSQTASIFAAHSVALSLLPVQPAHETCQQPFVLSRSVDRKLWSCNWGTDSSGRHIQICILCFHHLDLQYRKSTTRFGELRESNVELILPELVDAN